MIKALIAFGICVLLWLMFNSFLIITGAKLVAVVGICIAVGAIISKFSGR